MLPTTTMDLEQYCTTSTGITKRNYDFIAGIAAKKGSLVTFTTYSDDHDAVIEVDWGDKKWLPYESGAISSYALHDDTGIISIRSNAKINKITFGNSLKTNHDILGIVIARGKDLKDLSYMCYNLDTLSSAIIIDASGVETYKSAFENCHSLEKVEGILFHNVKNIDKMFKGCSSLKDIPPIFTNSILSANEAFDSCTALEVVDELAIPKCISFDGIFRSCISLERINTLDVSNGESFNHAFAYCIKLKSLPKLDFRNAKNLDYTFAYMQRLKILFFIDSRKCTSFMSTFEKAISLTCINGIDTNGVPSRAYTVDMFKECNSLINPSLYDQERIRDGYRYTNTHKCYYDIQDNVFYVIIKTTGEELSFDIITNKLLIDWGDGKFIPYLGGSITGMPINNNVVVIKTKYNTTSFNIKTDVVINIDFKVISSVNNFDNAFKGFKRIRTFVCDDMSNVISMNSAFEGCDSFVTVEDTDLSHVKSMNSTFKKCYSFNSFEDRLGEGVDLSECIDMTDMLNGCSMPAHIPRFITPVCEKFNGVFAYMDRVTCINGINTLNRTDSYSMFLNTPNLVRPTANEIINIENGFDYYNNGFCGGNVLLNFTAHDANTDVTINVYSDVSVDWGDGHIVNYSAGNITGKVIAGKTAYMIGDIERMAFIGHNFNTIEFKRAKLLKKIEGGFTGNTNITSFLFDTENEVAWDKESFKGCTSLKTVRLANLEHTVDFAGFFEGCTALETTGRLNTKNGLYFENMFKDCTSMKYICAIDTTKGKFPANYVTCKRPTVSCNPGNVINCSPGSTIICDTTIPCTTMWVCFSRSTMFDNCAPVTPNIDERRRIMYRYKFDSSDVNCRNVQ